MAEKPMAELFVNDEDLTIYQLAFPPNLFGVPHDHAGWAVIGVYSGAEGFNLYEEVDGELVQRGREVLPAGSVRILPANLIHDIDNPAGKTSGSLHVYSNRHFDMPGRRLWRDGHTRPDSFSLDRSFTYGMERTRRRRAELGIEDDSAPVMPSLESR